MLAQCRRVRQMRRSDQREWTFRLRQPREQWHRQLQFTDAGRDIDDLAEIRAWPAAAGQCGVETRVAGRHRAQRRLARSEEHTSELQSLMRTSYAVVCLKKQKKRPYTV